MRHWLVLPIMKIGFIFLLVALYALFDSDLRGVQNGKPNKALLLFIMIPHCRAAGSICYGTTTNGRLENGVQLPSDGKNFVSYSKTAELLGRTYVHSEVRKILIDSYEGLEATDPRKVFKYAETGFQSGGRFRPHKTHHNGLSVDFMVPVINAAGKSVHLPTHWFNKLGYSIEFDSNGQYENYRIDYEAMASHIVSLDKATKKHGHKIWRVIFDPELQPNLWRTKYGTYLKKHIKFSKRRSWVRHRHDEHYHVDFVVPCRPM